MLLLAGAASLSESPLTAVQMLWVNLIMVRPIMSFRAMAYVPCPAMPWHVMSRYAK